MNSSQGKRRISITYRVEKVDVFPYDPVHVEDTINVKAVLKNGTGKYLIEQNLHKDTVNYLLILKGSSIDQVDIKIGETYRFNGKCEGALELFFHTMKCSFTDGKNFYFTKTHSQLSHSFRKEA